MYPKFLNTKHNAERVVALRDKLQRAEVDKEILGMLDHPFFPTLYADF